jgi:hypothetical protein
MYASQVNRISGELAGLRSKLADERKKLADANANALKAAEGLSRATSTSQLSSKARELERKQKAAAAQEKKTADVERKAADKQKALSSAQASLDRAQRAQHTKDDRAADKRRKADLDHLKTMERARRESVPMPEQLRARPISARPAVDRPRAFSETFDVCLSFAGEQRDYVERIASALRTTACESSTTRTPTSPRRSGAAI